MDFTLTPEAVRTLVTQREYDQGMILANSGLVRFKDQHRTRGLTILRGLVRHAEILLRLELTDGRVAFTCRCEAHPNDYSCADVAAFLIEATSPHGAGFSVSDAVMMPGSQLPASKPTWERALLRILPNIPDEPDPVAPEEPLAIILKLTQSGRFGRGEPNIEARPARPGTRNPWIQSGISWQDLAFDDRFSLTQRKAAMELLRLHERWERKRYGYPQDTPEWVNISHLDGAGLAEAFRGIAAAEIPLVSAGASTREEIMLSQRPGKAFIDIKNTAAGLQLAAVIQGPDGERDHVLTLGNPPHMVAYADSQLMKARTFSIAPLPAPVAGGLRNLLNAGPLPIPNTDREIFENEYLEPLRHLGPITSEDGSFTIPPPARPRLALHLLPHEETLSLHFSWKYPKKSPRHSELEEEVISSIELKLGGQSPLGRVNSHGVFSDRLLTASQSIEFILYTLPLLQEHPDVEIVEQAPVPAYQLKTEPASVSVEAGQSGNDWFDLHVVVVVDEQKIPFATLLTALTNEEDYLVLDDLTVVPIAGEEFKTLRQLVHEAGELGSVDGERIRVHKLSIDWWQELVDLGIIKAQENQWLASMRELSGRGTLAPVQPPSSFRAELRPYQRQGLSWLEFLRTHQLGGVLADDMGLGKTVQILASLDCARAEDPTQKFLVIAPTSVVGNWAAEAGRFAPQLSTALVTSTAKKAGRALAEQIDGAQLVVTSYAIFRLDFDQFAEQRFGVLVLDEAQQLKNHNSKGYKQVRQLEVPCKIVVTGTPMENNLLELWALSSLAAPGLLGGLKTFKDTYDKPISEGDGHKLERLKKRLRPFVLRRTKEQVVPELPAKTEQILEVDLEPAHRRAYDRRFQRVRQEVLGLVDDVDSNRFKILQSLTLLRQLALDPSLVDEGSAPSAKLQMLRELITDAVEEGHKILVFSQFTGFLDKARQVAVELGIEHGYLDGSVPSAHRRQSIEDFANGKFPVFFISLKSGGFGINLTAADYCILLDPWWNPAAEAQAIDRTHRIGQDKPVFVYRLVAKDTIESKVLSLQAKKTALFNDVLGQQAAEAKSQTLTAEDFKQLIED